MLCRKKPSPVRRKLRKYLAVFLAILILLTVYAELADADCRPRYDIRAFLAARSLNEKRALAGNHLQAPAERLMKRFGIEPPAASKGTGAAAPLLCGAGPTYFSLGKTGPYRTVPR